MLSIGIVGLPNVGKSTLFQTITKKQVDCANYPFCTIDPNVGVVAVPDTRVDKLAKLTNSAKKIYATCEFVDIAGLVKGAAEGEGLGNKFLANIRETDAIVYVLRAFGNENIINTQENIDPWREKEILDVELILKDLETINKRMEGLERDVRANKKEAKAEFEVLSKAKKALSEQKILSEQGLNEEENRILKSFCLLTSKPRLYLLNANEKEISPEILKQFRKDLPPHQTKLWCGGEPFLSIDILSEFEAGDLTAQEKAELGLPAISQMDNLIKKCYELLGLITFLTTGPDETRAWTIKNGGKAPQAGGVIHTDFEKNFIKAEVINWQTLLDCGGFVQARAKGQIRTEGKEYVVQDGDVIEIKHGA
ncbi:MAG: redox-regulated ATPase YchF [Candidatus Pacebacteria bacterium]|nr:redox-regulated ATPase YchF [Candidatus Paceibacterota bacterium]